MKQRLQRLYHWEYFWLSLLLLATIVMHFSMIASPATLVFDEHHYVSDARSILQGGQTERQEHPSLGKLFIVAGIFLLGDNPVGWRFFSIIFGTINIALFYLICRRLAMSRKATSLATFMLALDNLSFVQSSVAMLDVFSFTFMLGAFWLYLKERYWLSGIAVGLSALAKLYGVLALPAIVLHWLLTPRRRDVRQLVTMFLVTALSFALLMIPFDFIVFHRLIDPISRIRTMLSLSGSLTFGSVTHELATRPWEWILRPVGMAYSYDPHYAAVISPTIWALIIPAVLYMAYRAAKGSEAGLFGVMWFVSTYLFWIPTSLITNRISFIFYFYPTVGAICIGLGLGLAQLDMIAEKKRAGKLRWLVLLVPTYLVLHVVAFVLLTPVFTR